MKPPSDADKLKSFIFGFLRSFDLLGERRSETEAPGFKGKYFQTSDEDALKSDFKAVGDSIRSSVLVYKEKHTAHR